MNKLKRNFCIIAHIDHGKSTLADRLLEHTHTIDQRKMMDQVLDNMDLERERGITIKSHAIRMQYNYKGQNYSLNLIDTPGHVDFSYEVSRAIASCEGALLVIDATQGIQAQTISNLYQALDHNLEIIPIINKIDMPNADPEVVKDQIIDLIGCSRDDIIEVSAKLGIGINKVLEAIIEKIPPPTGDYDLPLEALIFDSIFNPYRGVIAYFRIFNGTLKTNDKIMFYSNKTIYEAEEIGYLGFYNEPCNEMKAGDVGYIITGIKSTKDIRVGDTITLADNPCNKAIEGFKPVKPMVYAGVYPVSPDDYDNLRESLERLQLNDPALEFTLETSNALGYGFRCGFLGLLHMEIVQERLEREFNIDVIITVPNVSYKIYTTKGEIVEIHNPVGLPDPSKIDRIEEPYIKAQIITKSEFIGNIIKLCIDRRGVFVGQVYLSSDRVELTFEMPLVEILFDFYDKLKSISRGYASFDYFDIGYRETDLVKLDILLNGEKVDALSILIHRNNAYSFGRRMCEKLKNLIPRHQFDIAIQAAIGGKIIARETIKAYRKDVTAKCYGGDITRKRKLIEKQKEGKKRMRQIGKIDVPQSAFLSIFKLD
ncbi:MAG: translation elongation factor 4 [Bacteroidales bacterium]|jgi:GTP-binding protein LepA|nr:elongation factor 4 [Bacteroidales bacterium]MDI9575449.1 translation elongation factor 4 [Bacteroidota bacterium]MDD3756150.1 translation elongation factor 4 [Bacteroidales bacterium]MDY0401405.1 translation elongation factor 4 [Bacteroidales bacterium]HHW59252.1 elongation factor 4 [Bacteroidales bacterium]